MKISGVYKITNTVTGDFYIGSSKDVKNRWSQHKKLSVWKRYSNNPMYLDMQKYSVDCFELQILAEVEPEYLKEKEQQFIEMLKPTYNDRNANGWDFKRRKEKHKEYYQHNIEKYKYLHQEYKKSPKYKESHKKSNNKYNNQLCFYSGETLTLNTLSARFRKSGIEHPVLEAKKYLLKKESKTPIEIYDVYP